MQRLRSLLAHLFTLALPIVTAAGCCCGSLTYDMRAYETWDELEASVHAGATPIDQEQTGVSMQLPALFDPTGVASMRPDVLNEGNARTETEVFPALISAEKLVIVRLPEMRFAYEMGFVRDGHFRPVYCYLGVLPKGDKARQEAREKILESVHQVQPDASWETGKELLDGNAKVDYLEVTAAQHFGRPQRRSRREISQSGKSDGSTILSFQIRLVLESKRPTSLP